MYNKTNKPVKRRGAYMRVLMSLAALVVMAVAIVIAADVAAPHEAGIAGYISDEHATPYAYHGVVGHEDSNGIAGYAASNGYTEIVDATSYTGGGGARRIIYTIRVA